MLRYSRHVNLLGKENFSKIRHAEVLVAGVGGLGSHVLQVLARYGFGTLHIFDPGILDEPDLNRQILYDQNDLGQPKAESAVATVKAINPDVTVVPHVAVLRGGDPVPAVDLVVDCLDNFQGRLVIETLFFRNGCPVVHGGATLFFGQVTTLVPGRTPSLSEIYGREFMQTADASPKDIYPPTVMCVGSVQASEAIKIACGMDEDLLCNKILTIDLLNNAFETIELNPPHDQSRTA